jgi:hypothetical protein
MGDQPLFFCATIFYITGYMRQARRAEGAGIPFSPDRRYQLYLPGFQAFEISAFTFRFSSSKKPVSILFVSS